MFVGLSFIFGIGDAFPKVTSLLCNESVRSKPRLGRTQNSREQFRRLIRVFCAIHASISFRCDPILEQEQDPLSREEANPREKTTVPRARASSSLVEFPMRMRGNGHRQQAPFLPSLSKAFCAIRAQLRRVFGKSTARAHCITKISTAPFTTRRHLKEFLKNDFSGLPGTKVASSKSKFYILGSGTVAVVLAYRENSTPLFYDRRRTRKRMAGMRRCQTEVSCQGKR